MKSTRAKKSLSILLATVIVLTMLLGITVHAVNTTHEVFDELSLREAIDIAADGDTILFMNPITIQDNPWLIENKTLTFDLAGHDFFVLSNNHLRIIDSDVIFKNGSSMDGLFYFADTNAVIFSNMRSVSTSGDSTVRIIGDVDSIWAQDDSMIHLTGNSESSAEIGAIGNATLIIDGNVSGQRSGLHAWENATVNISGNVTGEGGRGIDAQNNAIVNIGGNVSGWPAIYASDDAIVNVGGNVSGWYAVQVSNNATVTIEGTVESLFEDEEYILLINGQEFTEEDGVRSTEKPGYYEFINENARVYIRGPFHPVIFDLNGGNVDGNPANILHTLPEGFPIGDVVPEPTHPTHTFAGWQTVGAQNLSNAQVEILVVDGPMTFTAQWTPPQPPIGPPTGPPTGPPIGPPTDPPIGLPTDPPIPPVPTFERQAYLIGNNGLIRPNDNITRAEVATIFFRLLTDEMRADYWLQTNPFPDVNGNTWFNNAVSTTTNAGIFVGLPDGTFAPDRTITRAELATAIVRFMDAAGVLSAEDQFDDIAGHWAAKYINVAALNGWAQGPSGLGGSFYPDRSITRAETAAIINRIFGRLIERPEDLLPNMRIWPDNMNVSSWYYLYMQSATNSYTFEWKYGDRFERWLTIIQPRDWAVLERPDSRPEDILQQ